MINRKNMPLRRVRVLGAPGSGRTQLTADLRAALSTSGLSALPITVDPTTPSALCGQPANPQELTLLMGLDLPMPPADRSQAETADRVLRDALARSGTDYQVVYGQGVERLHHALRAIHAWLPDHTSHSELGDLASQPAPRAGAWVWACDNCSDPQCERRLLSDLLAARQTAP